MLNKVIGQERCIFQQDFFQFTGYSWKSWFVWAHWSFLRCAARGWRGSPYTWKYKNDQQWSLFEIQSLGLCATLCKVAKESPPTFPDYTWNLHLICTTAWLHSSLGFPLSRKYRNYCINLQFVCHLNVNLCHIISPRLLVYSLWHLGSANHREDLICAERLPSWFDAVWSN